VKAVGEQLNGNNGAGPSHARIERLEAEVGRLRAQVRDLLVCQQVFVDGWQAAAREAQELRERLLGTPPADKPPW
jgi:hypothetical protein